MTDGSVRERFGLAVSHHSAGRLRAAEALYREILVERADDADALHLLGVAVLELGRPEEALDYVSRAIDAKPSAAVFRLSLGQVQAARHRVDDAISAYRDATRLAPHLVDAWFGLGVALQKSRDDAEAVAVYHRVLELQPDHADACNNLGSALELSGRLNEAIDAYQRALKLAPNRAATHNNL